MPTAMEMVLNSILKSAGVTPQELMEKGADLHRFSEALVKGIDTLIEQNNRILANQARADEQMALTQRIAAVRALSPTGKLPDLSIEDDALFDPIFCAANGLKPVYSPATSNLALSYKRRIAEIEADPQGDQDELARMKASLASHLAQSRFLLGTTETGNA